MGRSHESDIDFTGCDLPSDWDVSTNTLNISDELHAKLIQQISVQRNLIKSLLQQEFVGNVAESSGVMVLAKLLT